MGNKMEKTTAKCVSQVAGEQDAASGASIICMNCGKKPATRIRIDGRGRKQYRCEQCCIRSDKVGVNRMRSAGSR